MFNPALWADILLFVHFLFILGIIVPIPLIILGGFLQWNWIRNLWFRYIHLTMIGIVVLETLTGIFCPLTVWEQKLRALANQQVHKGPFINYWVSRLIYYDFKPWVFHLAYFCAGALIVMLIFIFPPQRKK